MIQRLFWKIDQPIKVYAYKLKINHMGIKFKIY